MFLQDLNNHENIIRYESVLLAYMLCILLRSHTFAGCSTSLKLKMIGTFTSYSSTWRCVRSDCAVPRHLHESGGRGGHCQMQVTAVRASAPNHTNGGCLSGKQCDAPPLHLTVGDVTIHVYKQSAANRGFE